MAEAKILDGKALAATLRRTIADAVDRLEDDHKLTPGLAVVLVGENPASQVYVRNKSKQCAEVGMRSLDHHLPADVTQNELLTLVHGLNNDPQVNGILVQLPLPEQIEPSAVINAIDPAKDVDGFHVINAGLLSTGGAGTALVPCTPSGCMMLIGQHLSEPGRVSQGGRQLRARRVCVEMAQVVDTCLNIWLGGRLCCGMVGGEQQAYQRKRGDHPFAGGPQSSVDRVLSA